MYYCDNNELCALNQYLQQQQIATYYQHNLKGMQEYIRLQSLQEWSSIEWIEQNCVYVKL